uniref:U34-Eretoxin-Ek1a_1 n=1 Tax=Eresus cinnaberinus TaxID=175337 RepID=A0A2D0PDY8_ERECI
MQAFWVLLLVSAFAIANCDDDSSGSLLDPKDMQAIQERLEKMDFLEKIVMEIFGFKKSDARDDTCLPVGAECHFWKARVIQLELSAISGVGPIVVV